MGHSWLSLFSGLGDRTGAGRTGEEGWAPWARHGAAHSGGQANTALQPPVTVAEPRPGCRGAGSPLWPNNKPGLTSPFGRIPRFEL